MSPGPHDHSALTPVAEEPAAEGASAACPYCGGAQRSPNKCECCGAHTDPLSRQATQNEMGPWFVRDEANPFRPGCRLETIERWARSGRIGLETVIRGPSTNQHWTRAIRVPGIARLLGRCHACQEPVEPVEVICGSCGASLETVRDRQHLGLSPVRALPGRTEPGLVASSLLHAQPARITPKQVSPGSTARSNPAPSPSGDQSARLSRLDRRLKRAERRAVLMTVAAAAFALLFAVSLAVSRVDTGEPMAETPSQAQTQQEPDAVEQAGRLDRVP